MRQPLLALLLLAGPAAAQLDRSDPPDAVSTGSFLGGTCDVVSSCANPSGGVLNGSAYTDNGRVWFTDFTNLTLNLYDTTTCTVLATCPAPGGASPSENAYLNGILYHYDFGTGLLYGIDPATCAIVSSCDPPGNDSAEGLTSDGTALWKGDSTTLYRFDPITCVTLATCPNPSGQSADGLAWCGGKLVMFTYSGQLIEIDPQTCTTGQVCVPSVGTTPNGITAGGGNLYVDSDAGIETIAGFCSTGTTGNAFCFCANGPCGNNDSAAGCANSTGSGARILSPSGSTSVSADDLFLAVIGMPAGQNGLVFMGGATASVPFGDGTRCIAPGAFQFCRFPITMANGSGAFGLGPGIVAFTQTQPVLCHIDAGETWHFQGWYRDPQGPCGNFFNLTHGLSIAFTP